MSDGITDGYRYFGRVSSIMPYEKDDRPSWDSIWSDFAESISKRSPDPKHKVGAVIVTTDNTQVLAVGYNGDQKGGSNKRESLKTGCSGFIHAELNALIKCDFNFPKDKKLYVTLSPCIMCSKAIINADIKQVIYINNYLNDNDDGTSLLRNYGIFVRQFIKQT
jgi:dCMP deaminase